MAERDSSFIKWMSYLNNIQDKSPDFDNFSEEEIRFDHKIQPSMYQLWLVNDSIISDELFLEIIERFFMPSVQTNISKALSNLRKHGQTMFGTYTREVAESKVIKIVGFSQSSKINVKCLMRKEQEYVSKKS